MLFSHRVYGIEIQAQRMMNDAIVELKRQSTEGSVSKELPLWGNGTRVCFSQYSYQLRTPYGNMI